MCQGERGDEALVFKKYSFLVTLHSTHFLLIKYSLLGFRKKALISSDLT